jgi:hypothetical protein
MWLEDPDELSIPFGLTTRESARFQCTAEHLVARQDGGRDAADNIVAACRFCNATRHRLSSPPDPAAYRRRVLFRLDASRWLPNHLRLRLTAFTVRTRRDVSTSRTRNPAD